ncbi:MAG: flagellar biosynthesis protein FlgC [Rhodospirillales bacterium]|nr:flagellar biosynthesis protein FlgC [Rhodospirillales bacterium]
MSIALSGLMASSRQADTAAQNIANVGTSGALSPETPGPAPYNARLTTQTALAGGGVRAETAIRSPGFVPAYDPGSPFSNKDGYIGVPNVDLGEEIITLKMAELTYKANVKTLEAVQNMSEELLNAFDEKI